MSLAPGSRVGDYEIVVPIAAGGMGEVYRARDPKLRRQVAIKILPAEADVDLERLAALSHPNILSIHDFGSDRGIAYAVMELVDGQSLRDLMRAGLLPRWKALRCATQIAKGLEAAHARGVVHRHLQPENVMVSAAGQVRILDFGLAADRAGVVDADAAPGYLSPEQVRGEAGDHRSDIFSFGCIAYEMLSGRRAFGGEPPDFSTLTNAPESIVRIVARCMAPAPDARFQSATDLVLALGS